LNLDINWVIQPGAPSIARSLREGWESTNLRNAINHLDLSSTNLPFPMPCHPEHDWGGSRQSQPRDLRLLPRNINQLPEGATPNAIQLP
jgi:hypothetical protein